MLSRKTIDKFIELRVDGNSYDEISNTLKVSKPTLIKWGRLYKNEITYTREYLTSRLAEKIANKNKDLINNIALNINRAETSKEFEDDVKGKFIDKSFKKLGDIFKVEVRNIVLSMNENGDITRVEVNTDRGAEMREG